MSSARRDHELPSRGDGVAPAPVGGGRPYVLFTITNGWGIRNFVHTGIVSSVGRFADIGIATTSALAPYFHSLDVQPSFTEVVELPNDEPIVWKRIRQLIKALFQADMNISTAEIAWTRKSVGPISAFGLHTVWTLRRVLAATWQVELLERVLDRWALPRIELSRTPNVVVNCSPFHFKDNGLQRLLQLAGVRTMSVIPSWDNPSSKGRIVAGSDIVLVSGPEQKAELLKYYRSFTADRLIEVGLPQFDVYHTTLPPQFSRQFFLQTLGIPPTSRLILYATGSESLLPDEPQVVNDLAAAILDGQLGHDVHLLVRCHPADRADRYLALGASSRVTVMQSSVESKRSRTPDSGAFPATRRTGGVTWNEAWAPPEHELIALAACLRHSEVCINIASTITIDALESGTKVINVRYDGQSRPRYLDSVRRFYDHHHYRIITESDVVPIVDSQVELVSAVRMALSARTTAGDRSHALLRSLCARPPNGSANAVVDQIQRLAARAHRSGVQSDGS